MEDNMKHDRKITERRAERKSRKNRKNRKVRSWIICAAVTAVVVCVVLVIVFSLQGGVSTVVALKGVVEEKTNVTGFVFRNQSVMKSPVNGFMEAQVSEGDRVQEEQVLGYIQTGEYNPERTQKILEVKEKIARLENNTATNDTYAGSVPVAEREIANVVRGLSDVRRSHSMQQYAKTRDELNLLIERKQAIQSGGTVDTAQTLADLKLQLSDLEQNDGGERFALKAPIAGVFSTRIDGLEEKLSPTQLESVTVAYIKELEKTQPQHFDSVAENQPVCKVVDNYTWYYVALADAKESEQLQKGKSVKLRFPDLSDIIISGKIDAVSPEEDGKIAVTIRTNRYVDNIYATSRTAAEIVTVSAEGIKLPVESIRVKDGQTGVYVRRLDVARFVPIKVQYKNDKWAIVAADQSVVSQYKLQIYDEVIVDAKNIEDGKDVR